MRLQMARLNIKRRPRSGDSCQCAKCTGRLRVQTTIVKEEQGVRIQYLSCELCHFKPEQHKVIIPLDMAPPRPKKPS